MAICGFSTPSWQVCVLWIAKNHKKLLKPLSQSSFSEIKSPMPVLSWLVFAPSLGKSSVHVPLLWWPGCSESLLLSFGIAESCVALLLKDLPTLTCLCSFPVSTLQVPLSASQLCVLDENMHFDRENSDLELNARPIIIQKLPIKCNGNLRGYNCIPVSSIRCSVWCHCGRNDLSRYQKPRSSRMMQLNPSSSSFVWNTGAELKGIVLSGELRKTCSAWKQILEWQGKEMPRDSRVHQWV